MTRVNPLYIASAIAVLAIVVFWWVASTMNIVFLFIPGTIISYFIYLKTFYKDTPDPKDILPIYLFALGVQLLHFGEEYIINFTLEMPKLINREAYSSGYWVAFNMVAYFIFLLGGIALFKQIKGLLIIPAFFIVVGVIFNSIAHIAISIYTGGYFPGLYTGLIYILMIPVLVKKLMKRK